MTKKIEEMVKFVGDNGFEMIDLKFIDLFGSWHHVTIPAIALSEKTFSQGVGFDGSSTRV